MTKRFLQKVVKVFKKQHPVFVYINYTTRGRKLPSSTKYFLYELNLQRKKHLSIGKIL